MNIVYGIFFLVLFVASLIFFLALHSHYKEHIVHALRRMTHKKNVDNSLRIASFIALTTLVLSLIGAIHIVSSAFSSDEAVNSIGRPAPGQGDSSISLITDSEIYTGIIDIVVNDKEYTFDEASELFSYYRSQLDECVLGDNESFLKVTSPLTFPSSIGDEDISISWHIANPDIIDYSGNIITDNLSSDGSKTEVVATLSLGDNVAEICYSIVVYPRELSPKDQLISELTEIINSPTNITKEEISLPKEINGHTISFYKNKSELPSGNISSCNIGCSASSYHF